MRARHGSVVVRTAVPSDAPAIAAVHVAAWQWAYRDVFPADRLATLDTAARTEMWRRNLERDDLDVWVATSPHIVGFVAAARNPDPDLPGYDELEAIYLLRSAQGVGVGRALMNDFVESLRDRHVPGAFLWVVETNTLAIRFYEQAGWHDDGTRRDIELLGGHPVTVARWIIDLG